MLQKAYDWFRDNKPDPESQKALGNVGNAYYIGRCFPNPNRPFAQRGSIAYAAWAAGIDETKEAQPKDPPPMTAIEKSGC